MAQLLAMTSELHPWRFEIEFFSKSVTLWTPLKKIKKNLWSVRRTEIWSCSKRDVLWWRSTKKHTCTNTREHTRARTLYAVYKPNLDNKQYLITALAVLSVPAITRLALTFFFSLFFFPLRQWIGCARCRTGRRQHSICCPSAEFCLWIWVPKG